MGKDFYAIFFYNNVNKSHSIKYFPTEDMALEYVRKRASDILGEDFRSKLFPYETDRIFGYEDVGFKCSFQIFKCNPINRTFGNFKKHKVNI